MRPSSVTRVTAVLSSHTRLPSCLSVRSHIRPQCCNCSISFSKTSSCAASMVLMLGVVGYVLEPRGAGRRSWLPSLLFCGCYRTCRTSATKPNKQLLSPNIFSARELRLKLLTASSLKLECIINSSLHKVRQLHV